MNSENIKSYYALLFVLMLTIGGARVEAAPTTVVIADLRINETANIIMERNKGLTRDLAIKAARVFLIAADYYGVGIRVALNIAREESLTRQITPRWGRAAFACSKPGQPVKSCAGAVGIMQVMPKYWGNGQCPHSRRRSDLNYITTNILCGVFVLAHYKKKYGDTYWALVAYNGGNRAVRAMVRGRCFNCEYPRKVLGLVV